MPEQERDDRGRFEDKVSEKDLLSMFEKGEPVSATEVADRFEISNRAALNNLENLQEEGIIERKSVGSRAVVWWRQE